MLISAENAENYLIIRPCPFLSASYLFLRIISLLFNLFPGGGGLAVRLVGIAGLVGAPEA